MSEAEQIVTDEQINAVWGNANFGSVGRRELIDNTVLKCASGYKSGHTATCIVSELGLVTSKWTLTVKGKRYLFAAFSGGKSL